MSCAPGSATFRLLDARVGWDPRPGDGKSAQFAGEDQVAVAT